MGRGEGGARTQRLVQLREEGGGGEGRRGAARLIRSQSPCTALIAAVKSTQPGGGAFSIDPFQRLKRRESRSTGLILALSL